jgi:RES domain-containing protein
VTGPRGDEPTQGRDPTVTAWRVFKKKLAKTAFTGTGARLYGGRWNSPGTAVVYLAQSQALAALEMLIHLEAADALRHYQVCAVTFPQALVRRIDPAALPAIWRRDPPPRKLQRLGDAWAAAAQSALLRVPSAVVPAESNFLLNPAHPDFRRVVIGKPQPFRFDRRLLT